MKSKPRKRLSALRCFECNFSRDLSSLEFEHVGGDKTCDKKVEVLSQTVLNSERHTLLTASEMHMPYSILINSMISWDARASH